jgi:hypothetical protein
MLTRAPHRVVAFSGPQRDPVAVDDRKGPFEGRNNDLNHVSGHDRDQRTIGDRRGMARKCVGTGPIKPLLRPRAASICPREGWQGQVAGQRTASTTDQIRTQSPRCAAHPTRLTPPGIGIALPSCLRARAAGHSDKSEEQSGCCDAR